MENFQVTLCFFPDNWLLDLMSCITQAQALTYQDTLGRFCRTHVTMLFPYIFCVTKIISLSNPNQIKCIVYKGSAHSYLDYATLPSLSMGNVPVYGLKSTANFFVSSQLLSLMELLWDNRDTVALNIISKSFHLLWLIFACKNCMLGLSYMVFSLSFVYECMKREVLFFFLIKYSN